MTYDDETNTTKKNKTNILESQKSEIRHWGGTLKKNFGNLKNEMLNIQNDEADEDELEFLNLCKVIENNIEIIYIHN